MRRLGLAIALGAVLAAGADARAVELEGTWYVLVHYQDAESGKPDAWRWEDRVWTFARKGDRLEWTEYPIVVLEDETGRFESASGNRASRVLAAWEPTPAQLADIKSGLQTNSRGVKTKTLRSGGNPTAWTSGEGATPDSAMVITYSETWSIEGLPEAPVFTRDDSMGGAATETMEGRTQYRAEAVRESGDEIVGSFERDGSRKGRFRLIRSSGTEKVRGSGLTQGQRVMQMFASQIGINLTAEQVKALAEGRAAPGLAIPDDIRQDVRAQIRQNVEDTIRQQGGDPRALAAEVDSVTSQIEKLILEEGKTPEEVQRMLEAGQITP
jgi:hypothetical protein